MVSLQNVIHVMHVFILHTWMVALLSVLMSVVAIGTQQDSLHGKLLTCGHNSSVDYVVGS